MKILFIGLVLCFITSIVAVAQNNYLLQVKKDTVQVNAKFFSMEDNITVKNSILMKKFKNNSSEDSVLSADSEGNLKFKEIDANFMQPF